MLILLPKTAVQHKDKCLLRRLCILDLDAKKKCSVELNYVSQRRGLDWSANLSTYFGCRRSMVETAWEWLLYIFCVGDI